MADASLRSPDCGVEQPANAQSNSGLARISPSQCVEQSANLESDFRPNCPGEVSGPAKNNASTSEHDASTSNAHGGIGDSAARTPTDFLLDAAAAAHSGDAVNESTSDWSRARVESTVIQDVNATLLGIAARTIDQPPAPVVRFFGDYEIQKELGRGGMGFVYRAKQLSLQRTVALKMIKVGMLADDDELRRFQNEAEAVALLDHPGIVPIFEVGDHEGQPYFTMKLIEGGTLAQALPRFVENPQAAVRLMIEIAQAIQHAHLRGVLHRDLKPANILLDQQEHPHITDFGLAKRIESENDLTLSGAIMGTPSYMSPEQALGHRGSITTAADVYGLGAILYTLLTGVAPFKGESILDVLDAVRTRPPEPPTKRNPKTPRDLELICLRCLEKKPADRYLSAGVLVEDLERFISGEPVSVRAAGQIERLVKWTRRKPTLAAAYTLGILALILGGLGAMAFQQWRFASAARDAEESAKSAAEVARDSEESARFAAEKARDGEATARLAAEGARDSEAQARATADGLRKKIERIEYGRSMEVTHQEYRDDNIASALALLEKSDPQFRGWEYRYLHRLCHFDLLTLNGHTSNVTSAAYSPDGSQIVTTSYDKTAKIWDAKTGAVILTLEGYRNFVHSAEFSPDGSRVVTTGDDSAIPFGSNPAIVWDAKTGARVLTLNTKGGFLQSAAFSPDGDRIVTGSHPKVQIWDAKTGAEIRALTGHDGAVKSVSFNADGSRIVSSSDDKTVRVWDTKTGTEISLFKRHSSGVASAKFSPDGSRILTASGDTTCKVLEASSGVEILTLRSLVAQNAASFSSDGSRIVTAGGNIAKVWDATSGAEIMTIKGHQNLVISASFSSDGSRVLTGSVDSTAKVWDARTNAESLDFHGQTAGEISASVSLDGTRVVTASQETTAKIWDARTGDQLIVLKGHTQSVRAAWFSPDTERIVTGSLDGSVRFWHSKTGRQVLALRGKCNGMVSPFSPDGTHVITGGWEKSVSRDPNSGFHFTIETADKTARVWDTKTGNEVLTLEGHKSPVNAAVFDHSGLRIATTSSDGEIKIWDAVTGLERITFQGNNAPAVSIAFSGDDKQVITVHRFAAIAWNAETGIELFRLWGHTSWMTSANYSPTELRIVTTSHDGTVKIWDSLSGAEVLSLKHRGRVEFAAFSSDGSKIVSAGNGLHLWDAAPRSALPH